MQMITIALIFLFVTTPSFSQNKEEGSERNDINRLMNNKETMPVLRSDDEQAVRQVLEQYSVAVENLSMSGTENLFTPDAEIYESEKKEGNYSQYLGHTLNPKLKEYKSLKYSDYKADINVKGDYAYVNETFRYTAINAKDNSETKNQGASVMVLKKIKGKWKIASSHFSSKVI